MPANQVSSQLMHVHDIQKKIKMLKIHTATYCPGTIC
jgi:hypothetical protein